MAGKKNKPVKKESAAKEQKVKKPLTTKERLGRIVEGNDPGYHLP